MQTLLPPPPGVLFHPVERQVSKEVRLMPCNDLVVLEGAGRGRECEVEYIARVKGRYSRVCQQGKNPVRGSLAVGLGLCPFIFHSFARKGTLSKTHVRCHGASPSERNFVER